MASVGFVLLSGCLADRQEAEPPYNLLLISYDTLRADHLGVYGYERDTSPSLDRLAQSSVVFETAIAQSASTYPSHMSLFQSRFSSQTSAHLPVLAEILRNAGYATAAFTDGGNVSAQFGFDRGFDSYIDAVEIEGLADLMPLFSAWLGDHQNETFFIFLHTYDIHLPYDPPEPYQSMFSPDYQGPVTGASTARLIQEFARIGPYTNFDGEVPLSTADRVKIEALNDGGIRYADTYLASIRASLEDLDLWDKTLIVFLSDHGEEFWEHGGVVHGSSVYQELVHVPLLIKLPNQRFASTRMEQPVRLVDVAPTVLEVLGLAAPDSMVGLSLLPLVQGRSQALNVISEMRQFKALIEWPSKLIVDIENRKLSLSDLAADPDESEDLASDSPQRVRELYSQVGRQLKASGSEFVSGIPPQRPQDPELVEDLRALGYLD